MAPVDIVVIGSYIQDLVWTCEEFPVVGRDQSDLYHTCYQYSYHAQDAPLYGIGRAEDAPLYGIGRAEVQRRGQWLEQNLMLLDPDFQPRILEYQYTLADVSSLLLVISPQSAIMNPTALAELFKEARYEITTGSHKMQFPPIPCGMVERDMRQSFVTIETIEATFQEILEDVVREGIFKCFGAALSQDVDRRVDAMATQTERQQMRELLSVQRRPGVIKSISVDREALHAEVMIKVKGRGRRLLRMLDVMAAACLADTCIEYAGPWREMMREIDMANFVTPHTLNLDSVAKPIKPDDACISVGYSSITLDAAVSMLNQDPHNIWPYLQGNHATKVVTPKTVTTPLKVDVGPYPKYPVYLLPIRASRASRVDATHTEGEAVGEGEGEREGDWVVEGTFTPANVAMLKLHGLRALIRGFSEWRCTTHPVTHLLTEEAVVTHCVPEYMALLGPASRTLPHAFRVHATLMDTVHDRLNQRMSLSSATICRITGRDTYEAVLKSLESTEVTDNEPIYLPPSAVEECLDSELFTSEWDMLEEYQHFIFTLPESAYYGAAVTHLSEIKVQMQSVYETARVTSADRHAQLLTAAVVAAARRAKALKETVSVGIYSPKQGLAVQAILDNAIADVFEWEGCLQHIEDYCEALLSAGCYIPTQTHCDMARLSRFVKGLLDEVMAFEQRRLAGQKVMCQQLRGLAFWTSNLASNIVDRCRSLASLSYETLGLLASDEEEGTREIEDPRVFDFLFKPVSFPDDDSSVAIEIQPVRGNTPDAMVEDLLASSGLVVAFQAITGLPVLPRALTDGTSGTCIPKDILDTAMSKAKACQEGDREGKEGERETIEAIPPFKAYVRPTTKRNVSVEEVLSELLSALRAARSGIALIDTWAADLELPGVCVMPHLDSVPGHPTLMHRCATLLRQGTDIEILLSSVSMERQDAEGIDHALSEMTNLP
ncbi:hypothetical protein KIPB_003674 [Kipferlia bialata]|uniref:Uncharacterized protein n=1 Tax=Kipferlia bialata TaxID=797122 RepID=A0A9K3CSN2_9EUKA|nr:hypothetical protein KIPB_003674 [Kipferlia bialata]|eukprot:g3674.t1